MRKKAMFFSALVSTLADPSIREGLFNAGRAGLNKLSRWLDTDGDGDVDQDDIDNIEAYLGVFSSLLGQVAAADGVVVEDEEIEAAEFFEQVVFSEEGLLPPLVLGALSLKKTEVRQGLMDQFMNPEPIRKIVDFAKEHELEESFYEDACIMANADKEIVEDEHDFLSEFAEMLNVNRIDRKRIERKYLA